VIAMRRGRERQARVAPEFVASEKRISSSGTSATLEALLARIYVEEPLRASFLAAPEEFTRRHELNPSDAASLISIDRTGLALAARSFARKRQLKQAHKH